MTGATGQDGYFLTQRLLDQGWTVYAAVRDTTAAEDLIQRPRPTEGSATRSGGSRSIGFAHW